MTRRSYEDSCQVLIDAGLLEAPAPPLPARMPRYDDEALAVQFFRMRVADVALDRLTLPRSYLGRSLLDGVSFFDSDLSQSSACWNDFVAVDFSRADLRGADLRASEFSACRFVDADLRGADLRHADFADCDFTGAQLDGAVLAEAQRAEVSLTPAQAAQVAWSTDAGEEPPGG